jgi:hypothetical protein
MPFARLMTAEHESAGTKGLELDDNQVHNLSAPDQGNQGTESLQVHRFVNLLLQKCF